MNSLRTRLLGRSLALSLLALAAAASAVLVPAPAFAQYVVAVVNGEPITAQDVAQRLRLYQVSGQQRIPQRQGVIEELITEKLKLQAATRGGVDIADSEVDRLFAQIARNSGRTATDFANTITKQGIDVSRFKIRVKTELAWRQFVQQRSPASFMIRDADIVALLTARGQRTQITASQYSLRQFIFVVPRGSSQAAIAARVREAEAFRKAFANCEAGVAQARQLRDVVIRDPVTRLSADLAPRLKQLLDRTPIGTLTPPEPIIGGIEVVAVCERKETVADVSSRREVREELLGQRVQSGEKELLDDFRKRAIIEYRNTVEQKP